MLVGRPDPPNPLPQIDLTDFDPDVVSSREHAHILLSEGSYLIVNKNLIEAGVAKESARMILPLTTETTMYMKGNMRSWIHYIELRTQENTQKEHRDIASECKKIFKNEFPNVSEAIWDLET